MYLATIKPTLNEPRPPGEINGHHLQHIRADAGAQFTSAEFLQACHDEGINVSLAAPKHQEMNGLCERTWQSVRNLAFSFMNYARVGEEFGGMALEHGCKSFAVIPIKGLRKECNVTTPFELFYGIKPSVQKFRTLFCPCVYKVYIRTKTVSSKTVRHFDSKTHPQRGVIGIFCGFPRSQSGYIVWEPRSRKLVVSADVQFDEKFHSMGPRQHFAFKDALPVIVKSSQPNINKIRRTDNNDDHEGVPKKEYTEETTSDGFLSIMRNAGKYKLFDNVAPQFQDDDVSDNESSMEEQQTLEEHPSMEERDTDCKISARISTPTPRRPPTPHPSDDDEDEALYQDPAALVQQPTRKSRRSRKKRRIFDPSDSSYVVGLSEFANLVTLAFDKDVTPEQVLHHMYTAATKYKAAGIEGADPSAFLPEPKSLKKIASMEALVKKAWLDAFRSELVNLISKNTFEIATNYKGEKCLPVCAIFRTKIKANGTFDKLKVRIAIRGDLDRDALDEDNSAPLATFRLLKVFLAEAARLKRRVYQADFIGAYLQACMDRLVYVILPKEYAIHFPDLSKWFGVPLVLLKSAYGISSAGRLWAEELFGWYIEFGFTQSTVKPSLFKYKKGNDWMILLSYCDDSAYFASSDEMRKKFEKAMRQRFNCKLLGQLHWFLQARITQDAAYNITIDQSRYCASMSKRFLPNEEIVALSDKDKQKYLAPLPNGMVFTKEDRSKNEGEVKILQEDSNFLFASWLSS
jgi:Reverse transcriptase (RNA-dependent DNA polymerase)